MFVVLLMPKRTLHEEYYDDAIGSFAFKVDHEYIQETEDKAPLDHNRHVFYCDNERQAEVLARYLAGENPGRDVAILTQTQIFSTIKPEVIHKKVTNEGVLPF